MRASVDCSVQIYTHKKITFRFWFEFELSGAQQCWFALYDWLVTYAGKHADIVYDVLMGMRTKRSTLTYLGDRETSLLDNQGRHYWTNRDVTIGQLGTSLFDSQERHYLTIRNVTIHY